MEDATRLSPERAGTRPRIRGRAVAWAVVLGLAGAPAAGSAAAPASGDVHPARAAEVLAEARTFAGQDRHGLAVACALAAIELDPSLEPQAALLIANQLTWQERAAEAVPWYRKHLESHPGDREGLHGLARALSWSGRHADARAIWEDLAASDPTDVDARLGVARMHAWDDRPERAAPAYEAALEAAEPASPEADEARRGLAAAENRRGRHHRAERLWTRVLEDAPDDDEALAGRGRALWWDGRGDAARAALADAEGPAARALDREIARDRGWLVVARAAAGRAADDQKLRTGGLRIERGVRPELRLGLEAGRLWTDEPVAGTIEANRLGFGGSWRATRSIAVNAWATVERVEEPTGPVDAGSAEVLSPEDVAGTRLLADGWATWTADWTRVDVGVARIPVDTPKSLARGLSIDLVSASVWRRLVDRLAVGIRGSRGDYSDGNVRIAGEVEAEAGPWSLGRGTVARILGGASAFAFDEETDRGYYAPSDYDALHLTLALAWSRGRWSLGGSSRVASERERQGDRFGVWAGGLDARCALDPDLGLSAFARKSTSRFDTGAGYEREGIGVALDWRP